MKLNFLLNVISVFLFLIILSGCAGIDVGKDFNVKNKKFTDNYPFYTQDIVVGRYTLRQGYNIVSYLPYNQTNLTKFEKILNELNKRSRIINHMKCYKNGKTFLQCRNKFAVKPTQYSIYFLKSDLKNIYLVEDVYYLREGVDIDYTFLQMHNMLIDILNENHIVIKSKNIKVDENMLIGHNKSKLINK